MVKKIIKSKKDEPRRGKTIISLRQTKVANLSKEVYAQLKLLAPEAENRNAKGEEILPSVHKVVTFLRINYGAIVNYDVECSPDDQFHVVGYNYNILRTRSKTRMVDGEKVRKTSWFDNITFDSDEPDFKPFISPEHALHAGIERVIEHLLLESVNEA